MPSNNKPIIAVCGATGFQGGSVVKHLLRDGSFAVRALTRKPNSAHAKELAISGVEVVQADFDNIISLRKAFKGCYGVFGVTDYFEAFEREAQQGFNIIDAAKVEGVKHIIFSTHEKASGDPPIISYKAQIADYLKESGVPSTNFVTSFYYGNVFLLEALKRDPKTGGWQFYLPFPTDVPIPFVSPRDIGAFILAGFRNPSEWIGRDMKVASERISPRQLAQTFAEVTGAPVKIKEVTKQEFLDLEHKPYVLQSWGVFKWAFDQQEGRRSKLDVGLARRLCPTLQSWREYAAEHTEAMTKQPPMLIQCYQTQEHFA